MGLIRIICAIITRFLFILVAFIGIVRVTQVKENSMYWLLILLFIPLVIEMIVNLRSRKSKGFKWFSPAIFLFLISIIPSMWILELHHRQNKANNPKCSTLDSWQNVVSILNNTTMNTSFTLGDLDNLLSRVCLNAWILALHQTLLILLIVGNWLLPVDGGVTRDELSQLLLMFVGIAADILEFTSETLSDIKGYNSNLVYVILAVWTWSMLQFPLHVTVVSSRKEDLTEDQSESVLKRHSTDIWSIMESLLIQDGPFLMVRLIVIIYYDIFHQMLVFFTIKNLLVVVLSLYRLYVLFKDTT